MPTHVPSLQNTVLHLEVLQWARHDVMRCWWNIKTCRHAAANGHLEVLQWARANDCPWDDTTCTQAAKHGYFEVVVWGPYQWVPIWNADTIMEAAGNGRLDMLQWMIDNGCPTNYYLCAFAAMRGHLH
jgi:hypothetical protein